MMVVAQLPMDKNFRPFTIHLFSMRNVDQDDCNGRSRGAKFLSGRLLESSGLFYCDSGRLGVYFGHGKRQFGSNSDSARFAPLARN